MEQERPLALFELLRLASFEDAGGARISWFTVELVSTRQGSNRDCSHISLSMSHYAVQVHQWTRVGVCLITITHPHSFQNVVCSCCSFEKSRGLRFLFLSIKRGI